MITMLFAGVLLLLLLLLMLAERGESVVKQLPLLVVLFLGMLTSKLDERFRRLLMPLV